MLSFFDAEELPAHPCRVPALASTFSCSTGKGSTVQHIDGDLPAKDLANEYIDIYFRRQARCFAGHQSIHSLNSSPGPVPNSNRNVIPLCDILLSIAALECNILV